MEEDRYHHENVHAHATAGGDVNSEGEDVEGSGNNDQQVSTAAAAASTPAVASGDHLEGASHGHAVPQHRPVLAPHLGKTPRPTPTSEILLFTVVSARTSFPVLFWNLVCLSLFPSSKPSTLVPPSLLRISSVSHSADFPLFVPGHPSVSCPVQCFPPPLNLVRNTPFDQPALPAIGPFPFAIIDGPSRDRPPAM
jgi:hypothetical protein